MSFLDRARERALAATEQLRSGAAQIPGPSPGDSAGESAAPDDPTAGAPNTREPLHAGIGTARAGLASLVERLDPRLVADVIIKATSLQERANAALRDKGSAYRIDGISITATIPPQISFSIGRSGTIDDA